MKSLDWIQCGGEYALVKSELRDGRAKLEEIAFSSDQSQIARVVATGSEVNMLFEPGLPPCQQRDNCATSETFFALPR